MNFLKMVFVRVHFCPCIEFIYCTVQCTVYLGLFLFDQLCIAETHVKSTDCVYSVFHTAGEKKSGSF
jgi:hypothetical protein